MNENDTELTRWQDSISLSGNLLLCLVYKQIRKVVQIKVLFLPPFFSFQVVPYGLEVRIPGFHPGGPGSTPGMGFCIQFDLMLCYETNQRQWLKKEI